MKVINIHKRTIRQPKEKIALLFDTLASKNDMMLATDKWPPMILDKGLVVGSKGGHGPIKYSVQKYVSNEFIQFEFAKPEGFNGFHKFEISQITDQSTLLKHTIEMNAVGSAILKWTLVFRWLHDAYMEDAFDKIENHFSLTKKSTNWNFWVLFLRGMLRPKGKKETRLGN